MKCAMYRRIVPTDAVAGSQRESLLHLIRTKGWTLNQEFVDTGNYVPQTNWPALEALLGACRQRKIDVIVVTGIDCFGLTTSDLLALLEEFQRLGVRLVSIQDKIDFSGAGGKIMFMIIRTLGRRERKLVGERIRAGIHHARESGRRLGRPPAKVDIARVEALSEQRLPIRNIAKILGIGKTTAWKILKRRRRTK